jgi:hypothetical protein
MAQLSFARFFRPPPKSTGATLEPRALPPDLDGTLTTLAKGVNDVLNYYIQVTDTKASIFIAGSVAAATFLLAEMPHGAGSCVLYVCAAAGLGCSLVLATFAILPRLPARSGSGSVFWGDIASCTTASQYRDRFASTASAGLLDEEYSLLNFQTARILRKKLRILRVSVLCFLAGLLAALPHYLMHS